MNPANINETTANNFANGFNNKQMTHSVSVNQLSKKPANPVYIPQEGSQPRSGAQSNNVSTVNSIYSRYSAHNQQQSQQQQHMQQHSHSTSNLIGSGKMAHSSTRQSATNGIKLMPSSQMSGNGQRADSPATQLQIEAVTNNQQQMHVIRSNIVNGGEITGAHKQSSNQQRSSAVRQQSSSGSANDRSSGNVMQTLGHYKEGRHVNLKIAGSTQNKQAKSFSSTLDTMPTSVASGGNSSKPPSSSTKMTMHSQHRTIDHTSKSGTGIHHGHQAKDSGSGHHHQSLSHMRTQATLGLSKHHHMNSNLIAYNQNNNSKGGSSSNSVGQKRGSDAGEHPDKSNKSSLGSKNRHSQQNYSQGQSRLVSHKTSINDFKKPVSLAHNTIGSHSAKNHSGQAQQHQPQTSVNLATPSSQVVSSHSYQHSHPGSSSTTAKQTASYQQLQQQPQYTPHSTILTSGSFKTGQKPPIGSESTKHAHSNSLQTNTVSSSTVSQHHHGGKRNSPRSQLGVFTKKQHQGGSSPSTRVGSGHPKQNFSNTSTNLQSTLTPKENEGSSKRRSGDFKSQIFATGATFKSNSHVQTSSSHSHSQVPSQHRSSTSLKNQVTHQAKLEKKLSNHQHTSTQLKTRNPTSKVAHSTKEHHHSKGRDGQNSFNPSLELQSEGSIAHHHRNQTKKLQQNYPNTTKNTHQPQSLGAARSSSVTLNQGKDINLKDKSQASAPGKSFQALQQTSGQSSNTLDRYKDKHPKLQNQQTSQQQEQSQQPSIGHQSTAKVNGGIPTILNAYKQRSASPSEATTSSKANTSNAGQTSKQHSAQQPQATAVQQSQKSTNSFVSHLSHKMAQNRAPQMSKSSASSGQLQQEESKAAAPQRDQRFSSQQEMAKLQPSSVTHQHKMTGGSNHHNNQTFQRKVRSATRAQELEQENEQQKRANQASIQASKQKITDRPSSASAGQKFIGRQQNLKELFERNWQSVNIQNKVDPQSGEATQIRTLTVVDANSMVHEEQQEAAALPLAPGTRIIIPNHEPTKCSNKRNGIVRAYAANTNQGLVRNYNEDRVSIILNIVKPEHRKHETWPTCSFFGVYDGHGGSACAEYLRDNLHHYVIKEESFPWEPEEAIHKGFAKAEARFLEMCQAKDEATGQLTVIERSGSCAIVILIVGEICYTANVGDSRAVLCSGGGQQMTALSRDHKPSDTDEYKRIIQAGGQIYQTTTSQILNQQQQAQQLQNKTGDPEFIVGPIRVLPGRLSVCRTFGDPEAKLEYRGGNPNVVQALPDIRSFQISKQHDFIALASDGIYDKLTDEDVGRAVWLTCEAAKQAKSTLSAGQVAPPQAKQQQEQPISVHQYCGLGVEGILKNSLMRQSLDNVTVVMVAFQNFKRIACGQTQPGSAEKLTENHQNQQQTSAKKTSSEQMKQAAGDSNKPTQKENNINFMNNKKIGAARSQQTLVGRSTGERTEPTTFQDRQLKRSSKDHSIPRQTLETNESRLHNNKGALPRTRSQTHEMPSDQPDSIISGGHQRQPHLSNNYQQQQQQQRQSHQTREGYSIRQQQEQANKVQQTQIQSKPPMSSQIGSGPTNTQKQAKLSLHHREQNSGGIRSLSLKEVNQLSGGGHHADQVRQAGHNLQGRLNQLANLNSNKSLSTVTSQNLNNAQYNNGTPSTQSSLKSGSIQQSNFQARGSGRHQQQELYDHRQAIYNQPVSVSGGKPSPSQITHHQQTSAQSNISTSQSQQHQQQQRLHQSGASSTSALIFAQSKA